MTQEGAAQRAGRLSAQYASAGDRDKWLALFAADAVVRDPVGKSPLDPEGQGHRGKGAIVAFWELVIAPGDLEFTIRESYPCGDRWCANVATLCNRLEGGATVRTDLVVVYEVNEAGLLVSLQAYWDYRSVEKQLAAVG